MQRDASFLSPMARKFLLGFLFEPCLIRVGLFPLRSWDCPVASPGFAELLDELVLRMEVFPFSAFFDYFLLFRFWPLLPKEILFLLNGQHKPASPLKYFLLRTTAYSGSFSCLLPIF